MERIIGIILFLPAVFGHVVYTWSREKKMEMRMREIIVKATWIYTLVVIAGCTIWRIIY